MEEKTLEKWDRNINIAGMKNQKDFKTYEEVPEGTYEIAVKNLELKASKSGDPMVSAQFKIVQGKHKGRFIFMNQVITQPFQVHIVNEFLKQLIQNEDEDEFDIGFENYRQYNDLILDIHEFIDGKYEYALIYGSTNKGFKTFEIDKIFEL